MASDDAGSVLRSPGAAESRRCIVGASPPRRRRDEPIAVTANHRQTKAAELKRLSGVGGGVAQQLGGAPTGHQEAGNQERERLVSDGTVASCNSKVML